MAQITSCIRLVTVGTLALFLILEEEQSTFHSEYDIGLLYVAFTILGYVPSVTNLLRVFALKRVMHFLKCFFLFIETI